MLIAVTAAGCAPDLGKLPELVAPDQLASTQSLAAPEQAWPRDAWWTSYGDPQLDTLIEEALKGAPDLKIAAARIRAAEGSADMASANQLPAVALAAGLQETKQSQNTGYPESFRPYLPKGWHHASEISARLEYQLDFFGKYRAAFAAARSQAEAAMADAASARLQLTTAVATAYANLMQLAAGRTAALEAAELQRTRLELTTQRFRKGLENTAAVEQAKGSLAEAEVELAKVERSIAAVRHQLAALVGAGPDRGLAIALPGLLHAGTPGLPASVGANLLGRRPDIVAAKWNALAASSAIDVANANFYPNVELTGVFGVQALDAKMLLQGASEFGKFGPAVTLPLFDFGRLSGVYRKARADYDAAVAVYDRTLTNALREVADAYSNRRSLDVERTKLREVLRSREAVYVAINARYRGGLARRFDALTAEAAVIAQRRVVAETEAQILAADVALIRALGGGYANEQQDRIADAAP